MNAPSASGSVRPLLQQAFVLLSPFWPLVAFAMAAGVLGGLATAWLLSTINEALHRDGGIDAALFVRFAALCLLGIGGTAVAGSVNSVVGQRIIAALRKDIAARILRAPIEKLETHRAHRLMSVLTGDVDTVSAFTFNVSGYDAYRQLFSTVFSDYYLFDDLAYGVLPEEAGPHLARLGIATRSRSRTAASRPRTSRPGNASGWRSSRLGWSAVRSSSPTNGRPIRTRISAVSSRRSCYRT